MQDNCSDNELQSVLFGMLLIFHANIWGRVAFCTTVKCDTDSLSPPSLPLSLSAFSLSAAQSPTVADPLQQAYAGVQHYAGLFFLHLAPSHHLFPLPMHPLYLLASSHHFFILSLSPLLIF